MENINVKSTIRKSVNVDQRKIKKIRLLVTFLCSKADFYLIWVFGHIAYNKGTTLLLLTVIFLSSQPLSF